jgi:hypothetical protein
MEKRPWRLDRKKKDVGLRVALIPYKGKNICVATQWYFIDVYTYIYIVYKRPLQ